MMDSRCPKHVEFFIKNKFDKQCILLAFIIRIYHDAWSSEYQIPCVSYTCHEVWVLFVTRVFCIWYLLLDIDVQWNRTRNRNQSSSLVHTKTNCSPCPYNEQPVESQQGEKKNWGRWHICLHHFIMFVFCHCCCTVQELKQCTPS